jgi:predicted MFS family arabinose efflux permease
LIVGPLVAAFGFVLLAVPAGAQRGYWVMFFPAVIVLGFGMAITVAPLTTNVMNSVGQDRVGTASGINNAIARVAGVLAIAVIGIVMVSAFRARLDRTLDHLSLPSGTLEELRSHESRLAGLQAPANLDPKTKDEIDNLIRQAFVFGFRIVMLICTGLALASAAVAWLMLPKASGASSLTAPAS